MTTWINLEGIRPGQMSQAEKGKYGTIPPERNQVIEAEIRKVVAQGWAGEKGRCCSLGINF